MQKRFRHALVVLIGLGALLSLSGCEDPKPVEIARDGSDAWETAKVKPFPIGKPFVLDGCKVQLYRIAINGHLNDVTLSTVDCPTARTTSSSQSCGKNCEGDTMVVMPKTDSADAATTPPNG